MSNNLKKKIADEMVRSFLLAKQGAGYLLSALDLNDVATVFERVADECAERVLDMVVVVEEVEEREERESYGASGDMTKDEYLDAIAAERSKPSNRLAAEAYASLRRDVETPIALMVDRSEPEVKVRCDSSEETPKGETPCNDEDE